MLPATWYHASSRPIYSSLKEEREERRDSVNISRDTVETAETIKHARRARIVEIDGTTWNWKIKVNHALKAALWLLEAVSLGEQEERPVQRPGRVPRVAFATSWDLFECIELMTKDNDWVKMNCSIPKLFNYLGLRNLFGVLRQILFLLNADLLFKIVSFRKNKTYKSSIINTFIFLLVVW